MISRKRRLFAELLETRRLLARDVLYLDFDSTVGGDQPPGNLSSTYYDVFSNSHWQSKGVAAPPLSFLDVARTTPNGRTQKIGDIDRDGTWDGDNVLNRSDALVVRDRTVQYVRALFKGFDVEVVAGKDGWGKLQSAKNNSDLNLFVLFVGGDYTSPTSGRLFGRTNQAPIGENNEWYGWVYAGNIADSMRAQKLFHNDDGKDLAWNIAVSAAHEFGHMLGLGHPTVPSTVFTKAIDIEKYCDADGTCKVRQNGPTEIFDPLFSVMSSGAKLRGTSFSDGDYSGWAYDVKSEAFRRNPNSSITEVRIAQNQRDELIRSFNDSDATVYNARGSSGFSHDSSEVDLTFASQTPVFPVLPSSGNAVGATTPATIASSFANGITQYRDQVVSAIASTLNLPQEKLVLIGGQLANLTGIDAKLKSLVTDVSGLATSNTMQSIRSSLEGAGFSVDFALTDGDFAALDKSKPSNFFQASRTFTLLNSKTSTSLRLDDLASLQFLKDIAGFSGNLSIDGNAAIHVSIGVDSNGFYFNAGQLLNSQFTVTGDVKGNISNFGWISGDATVLTAPRLDIVANTSDGKLRIADVGNNTRMQRDLDYEGFASIEVDAEVSVFDSNLIDFSGQWNWDISETGVVFDATSSGFDTESLKESIVSLAAQGLENIASQSAQLATIAKDLPLVGETIQNSLSDLAKSSFSFDVSETNLAGYLTERGIAVTSEIQVSDIFDGTYKTKSLIQFDLVRTDSVGTPISINASKEFSFNAGGAPLSFQFGGAVSANPSLRLNVSIGLDATQGPYIVEGTGLVASLPVEGNVTGKAKIGSLLDIEANARVLLPASLAFTFDDGDATANERLYVFSSFNLGDVTAPPTNTKASGLLKLENLSLTARTPASNIPVIGAFLDEAFAWRASGQYDLASKAGSFTIDENSIPTFDSIRDELFRYVAGKLVDANPIPADVGKVLGTQIAFLGNRTVADLIGMGGADLFLNPNAYTSKNADDAPSGSGITLNYDFAKPQNIIAMLSGKQADYFSITINQTFAKSTSINVLPPTLLYSFFGIVNFSGRIDVIPKMSANVNVQIGVDSNGFYVGDIPGNVLTLTGSIEARPALTGSLVIVPVAEVAGIVGIGARGAVDVVSPRGDGKVRFNEIVNSSGLVTSNFDLSFELFMNIGLEGKVGILGSGLEAAGRVDREFTIFEYPGESKQPGEDVFAKLKKDMENKGKALVCVGGFAAGGVFGGVVACGIAYGGEILQAIDDGARWVGDRFNETVKGAKELGGRVASTAQKAVDDAVETATEWRNKVANEVEKLPGGKAVLDFLDRLDDPVQSFFENNKIDVGWFGGREDVRAKSVANELSYQVNIDNANNTLTISPLTQEPLNLVISILEDQLVVDGVDFQKSVYTRESRKRTYDSLGFPKGWTDWENDGDPQLVTFSNMTRVPSAYRLVINGTNFDDKFTTTDSGKGLPRSPIHLNGLGGNDLLVGGNGDDVLNGGSGQDRIIGSGGNDSIQGGGDGDFLYGGAGSDTINGGGGNDLIDESEGTTDANDLNRLIGGIGEDQINGGLGRDWVEGGDDKDTIRGNGGADQLYGGTGFLTGLADLDSSGDYIEGGNGDDVLDGGQGDDILIGGSNVDTIRGGIGNDVIYSHLIEPRDAGGARGFLFGGPGQDIIYGGSGVDDIVGGPDADLLFGGESGDNIFADSEGGLEANDDGNDIVFGDGGNDTIYLSGGGDTKAKFVNSPKSEFRNYVAAGAGIDTIFGGAGPDFIDTGDSADEASGGGGSDVLVGVSGADILRGESGDDFLYAGTPEIANLGAELRGGNNNDELYGDSGDDTLFGEGGDDLLVPKTGKNTADGGEGNDDFLFGFGTDVLRGSAGDDQFFLDNPTGTLAISPGEILIIGGGQSGDTVYFRGGGNSSVKQELSMSNDRTEGLSSSVATEGTQKVRFTGVGQIFDYEIGDVLKYVATDDQDSVLLGNGIATSDLFAAISTTGFARYEFRNKNKINIETDASQFNGSGDTIEIAKHPDMTGTTRLTVSSYSGSDSFHIRSLNDGVTYDLLGGAGDDHFLISDSAATVAGSTADVRGVLTVDGGSGSFNRIVIDDRRSAGHNAVQVTDSSIVGTSPVPIKYTGNGSFNSLPGFGIELRLSEIGDDVVSVTSTREGDSHLILGFGGADRLYAGVATPDQLLGDLGTIQGYVFFDGGIDSRDALYADDEQVSENFDYRVEPGELRHLPNAVHLTRTFAGIGFSGVESARLDASRGKNRISVRPSLETQFIIDGNSPEAEDCPPGGGDFLALDVSPLPPRDIQTVSGQSITFTNIVDGRQKAGFWKFRSSHKELAFESIEGFNFLDKLIVSSDAAWSASNAVGVSSPVTNSEYSDLVTNFTQSDLTPFSSSEFPSPAVVSKEVLSNFLLPSDVNFDGNVSPLDALIVINHLNRRSGGGGGGSSDGFLDVNNDGNVSPLDALLVINTLNSGARPSVTFGGVRTTAADLNCDGVDEVIAVSGANHIPTLLVFNGVTGELMGSPQNLTNTTDNFGTNVTAGDIDGDGKVELITSSDRGPGIYSIWRWENGLISKIADRTVAFSTGYLGGVDHRGIWHRNGC